MRKNVAISRIISPCLPGRFRCRRRPPLRGNHEKKKIIILNTKTTILLSIEPFPGAAETLRTIADRVKRRSEILGSIVCFKFVLETVSPELNPTHPLYAHKRWKKGRIWASESRENLPSSLLIFRESDVTPTANEAKTKTILLTNNTFLFELENKQSRHIP